MKQPSDKQIQLIKKYVLLPILHKYLELDREQLRVFKIPEVWEGILDQMMIQIEWDLTEVRRQLRREGIKFPTRIKGRYGWNGYRYEFGVLPGRIKAECEMMAYEYMKSQKGMI